MSETVCPRPCVRDHDYHYSFELREPLPCLPSEMFSPFLWLGKGASTYTYMMAGPQACIHIAMSGGGSWLFAVICELRIICVVRLVAHPSYRV